jgi:hypothetical protein
MIELLQWVLDILPDIAIYGSMAVIMVCAVWKCFRPVLRNTGSLRHAGQLLTDGSRMKLTRPVWEDVSFLGKPLQREWRQYLQNAETLDSHGQPCNVEDYVNEDSAVFLPGNAAFADIVPGLFTSLGILGTFIGLASGLSNVSLSEMERTITQMIAGLALAFNTSIVGLVCALSFNVVNKMVVGRARKAVSVFLDTFYRYGAPRPIDTANQLVSLQQEQLASLRSFGEDLGGSLSREIEQAVGRALHPVAQSMDRFLEGTTRQQIEGLRHIVNQFVLTMDQVLKGQLHALSDTLEQTVHQQQALHDEMHQAAQVIGAQAGDTEAMRQVARQVMGHFDSYVAALTEQSRRMEGERTDAAELLTRLHNAAAEQADYLAQLREHQEALEKYLQDYYLWIRGFSENLGAQTQAQREALSAISLEMREGADLLQGSYGSFVENIQEGLSSALGLFDESVQRQTGRITLMLDAISHGMPLPKPSANAAALTAEEPGLREDIRTLTNALQGLSVLLQREEARKEVG